MNPEEREELAELLPSPGEPVLTNDRHDLLKDHLMRELTERAPQFPDITVVPGRRARAPRRRFVAIAVPLVTATAVIAAFLADGGGSKNATTDADAVDLLHRIAAVAAAKESVPVRDDQYVYVRTQGTMKFSDKDIRVLREASWTAVDGKRGTAPNHGAGGAAVPSRRPVLLVLHGHARHDAEPGPERHHVP
ncbi:hypothetical protein [Streptomyces tauricus]|uniref:hypothetical protein n=1 Tax=Streptomyces tauricus TaxID=68274 RepID=UPI00341FBE6F